MAKAFVVHQDRHSHGGHVFATAELGFCNGKALVCKGDEALCDVHGKTYVASASSHMLVDGKNVALHGDMLACGATLIASDAHAFCF